MKISRKLDNAEIASSKEYVAPPPPKPEKPSVKVKVKVKVEVGDVLSYDAAPRAVGEVYPERKRRIFGRVSGLASEGTTRYTRLSYMRANDWQEFDTDTIKSRLASGEMELHDKWELLELIAQAFESEGNNAIAQSLRALQQPS